MKNAISQQIVVGAQFASQALAAAESSIPCEGRVVFSELAHPIYEAVFEVRLMVAGNFRIFHHHGDPAMAWQDETAPAYLSKQEAIDKIREYQEVFCPSYARGRQDVHAF